MLLAVDPAPAGGTLAAFVLQGQSFSRRGFVAPLAVLDGSGGVLWSADLPLTPSGDSCQDGDHACAGSGAFSMPARPSAFAGAVPPTVGPYSLAVGFTPQRLNSWGARGGLGCQMSNATYPCWLYGPQVHLGVQSARVAWLPSKPDDSHPALAWRGEWSDWRSAFASGSGDAAALMVTGCASATAVAALGWTPGGVASVAFQTASASDYDADAQLDARLAVRGASYGPGDEVPEGPLELRLTLGGGLCNTTAWTRVLAGSVRAGVSPAPPPPGAFSIHRAVGSCVRSGVYSVGAA